MSKAEILPKYESIPRGYKSYTFLLIPEKEWLDNKSKLQIDKVFQRFHAFGASIGTKNLAFWFFHAHVLTSAYFGYDIKAVISDPSITYDDIVSRNKVKQYSGYLSEYDAQRAREYCDRYFLNYNDGPYIIHTDAHPDEVNKPHIVIKLHSLSTRQYILLLNELEQSITSGKERGRQIKAKALFEYIKAKFEESKKDIFKIAELVKGTF